MQKSGNEIVSWTHQSTTDPADDEYVGTSLIEQQACIQGLAEVARGDFPILGHEALKDPQRNMVATKSIGSRLLKTTSGNVSRNAQDAQMNRIKQCSSSEPTITTGRYYPRVQLTPQPQSKS
jgi:hypothetical protein